LFNILVVDADHIKKGNAFTISRWAVVMDVLNVCKHWSLNCTPPPQSDGCQERGGGANLKRMTLGTWKDKSWK
jgi:hypothetical protein